LAFFANSADTFAIAIPLEAGFAVKKIFVSLKECKENTRKNRKGIF
jgi:hypothetical protein